MNTSETQNPDTPDRPFGYWLKAVDRLMAAEFAAAFESEGASRGDWRMLNAIDGSVPSDGQLPRPRLRRLAERGWIIRDGENWTLTDEGRAAKSRLGDLVDGIRAKVTDAISPDDLATTLASLADIARAFGWDEETPLPRRRGRHDRRDGHRRDGDRRGFGPRGRGFGPGDWRRALRFAHLAPESFGHGEAGHGHHGHGFGSHEHRHGHGHNTHPRHGGYGEPGHHGGRGEHGSHRGPFGHDHGGHDPEGGCRYEHPRHGGHGWHGANGGSHGHRDHGEHRHAGPHRAARLAQHAYERGFDAGFAHGRAA